MKVTVVCFGAMREHLPPGSEGNRVDLEVAEGATIGSLADALGAPRALVKTALVNGERRDIDESVDEGDEVTLMPPFTGGT